VLDGEDLDGVAVVVEAHAIGADTQAKFRRVDVLRKPRKPGENPGENPGRGKPGTVSANPNSLRGFAR
jgi:hypothetical protein